VLRLFLAFNLLLLNLYACKGGFPSCQRKTIDSASIEQNSLRVPITKKRRLLFSTTIPNAKIIKYDEFLSLYLVEEKKGYRYPFRFNAKAPVQVAGVNKRHAIQGRLIKRQVGLNKLGVFNAALFSPSLLLSDCCDLEGFVTSRGIIEKDYLTRFIKTKDNAYSDVGVRVKQESKSVIVTAVDPYVQNNPFKEGDTILKRNAKPVKSAASFMKETLFAKVGSTQKFQVKRAEKTLNLSVLSAKRFGGGYVSDTFLERKGVYFDKELKIVRLSKAYNGNSLKLCDKLIQVNGKKVQNQQEVMQTISAKGKIDSLLIQRDNFQFFVQIN